MKKYKSISSIERIYSFILKTAENNPDALHYLCSISEMESSEVSENICISLKSAIFSSLSTMPEIKGDVLGYIHSKICNNLIEETTVLILNTPQELLLKWYNDENIKEARKTITI